MKVLLTGDWHLDQYTAGMPRGKDVMAAFEQLNDRVYDGNFDLIVFLGDMANPDRGSRTVRAITDGIWMIRALKEAGCAIVMVAGNHDVVQDSSGLTTLSPMRYGLGGPIPGVVDPLDAIDVFPGMVAVAEDPGVYYVRGSGTEVCTVVALPFVSSARSYDPAEFVHGVRAKGISGNVIVAGHLQLEGALLGSETTDMPRGRDVRFPVAGASKLGPMFNGHYHKRQTVSGVECPGSLVRLAFGEEGNSPGWLEVEL